MKTKINLLTIVLAVVALFPVFAEDKGSDAALKQKLLGYWASPRHAYLIKSDGVTYMCPRKYATTTNKWAAKNGIFYEDGDPHELSRWTRPRSSIAASGRTRPLTL